MSATPTSRRSASGSAMRPKRVSAWRRRARMPSTKSVAATTPKIPPARSDVGPSARIRTTSSTGNAARRATVSALGIQRSDATWEEMIGARGFEPPTARPPAGCATRLRHAPRSPHLSGAGTRCPARAEAGRIPRRWPKPRSSPHAPTTSRSGTRTSWRRPRWPRTAPRAARWSSARTATASGSGCRPRWTRASRPAAPRTSTCRSSSRSRTCAARPSTSRGSARSWRW